jgi:hypothetical protein
MANRLAAQLVHRLQAAEAAAADDLVAAVTSGASVR